MFRSIWESLWVSNLICIIRIFMRVFHKRISSFSSHFSHVAFKWCQNISCRILSNFTKRIVIIGFYLNRQGSKAKDLPRPRLLQSPHRDRAMAEFLSSRHVANRWGPRDEPSVEPAQPNEAISSALSDCWRILQKGLCIAFVFVFFCIIFQELALCCRQLIRLN